MPNTDRILTLKLLGDTNQINKSLKGTEGRLKGFSSSAKSWFSAFAGSAVIGGIELLGDKLGDAIGGFENGQRVADQLSLTWKNLNLPASELSKTLDEVTASTLKLGTSDDEAVQVFNDSIKRTHSRTESLKRLKVAQDLAASRDISLGAAMKIVDAAAKGSAKAVDQFGLKGKTAGERVKELGQQVKGAAKHKADLDPLGVSMNLIDESLEDIVSIFATGDIQSGLDGIASKGQQLVTIWSNLSGKVVGVLDKFTGGAVSKALTALQPFVDQIAKLADDLLPKLGPLFDSTVKALGNIATALGNVVTFAKPVVDIFGSIVAGSIGAVLDTLKGTLDTISALLNGDFTGAWTAISTTVGTVADDISTTFDKVLATIQNILPGIQKAAGDIGSGIVDGIVNLVKNLPDKLVGIIRDAANGIIDVWNKLDFHIPAFAIPKIDLGFDTPLGHQGFAVGPFQVWGDSGDLIPNLPHLADGGIVKARRGGTLALLGEAGRDEAVIPLGKSAGQTIIININAPVDNPAAMGAWIDKHLTAARRVGLVR